MAITSIGSAALKAYGQNMQAVQKTAQQISSKVQSQAAKPQAFSETLNSSLKDVNEMQLKGASMVEEFATGKNTNVHELMIHMQQAGLAVKLTTAVRNKVMTAYQELMRMQM